MRIRMSRLKHEGQEVKSGFFPHSPDHGLAVPGSITRAKHGRALHARAWGRPASSEPVALFPSGKAQSTGR